MEILFFDQAHLWAENIVSFVENKVRENTKTRIALSGGNSPRSIYSLLGISKKITWSHVELFQTDERLVPHTHPDSNYSMLQDVLLEKLPLNSKMHFLPTSPIEIREKDAYEKMLDDTVMDITILGLGKDGHIASLLPSTSALQVELSPLTLIPQNTDHPHHRISMTMEYILKSKTIILLTTREKTDALQELLFGENTLFAFPAKALLVHQNLHIFHCTQ